MINDIETQNHDDILRQVDRLMLELQQKKLKRRPTFIGVGAGRSGTSAIYRFLNSHPDSYVSPVKEVNYFGFRDKKTNPYGMSFNEYLRYFAFAPSDVEVIGEISPIYFTLKNAASLIASALPDAKILITLRDPLSRFLSQYKHHLGTHKISDINEYVSSAIVDYQSETVKEKEFKWFLPVKNLRQSLYADAFREYSQYFHAEKICVVFFDDIHDEDLYIGRVCKFLNITKNLDPLGLTNKSFDDADLINRIKLEYLEDIVEIFFEDLVQCREFVPSRYLDNWLLQYNELIRR